MGRAALAIAACALLGALATPAEASDEELGLWRAMLAIGDGEPGEVVGRADAARDSLLAFGRDLRIDPTSVSMMDKMREAVIELDLGGLYGLLPRVEGLDRSIRVHGAPTGDDYYDWTVFPADGATCDGRMFAVDGLSRLSPVEQDLGKGKGFAVHQSLDVGTGPWKHGDVAAVAEALLVEIEAASRQAPTAEQAARVKELQPKLTGDVDRALAAATLAAAPRLSQTVSGFMVVDRIGEVGEHGLDVDLVGRIDTRGLARSGYPVLARYIEKLGNLLVFDLSVRDPSGLPLVVVGFYSAGPGARVAFTTHDGALVPRRKGVPDPTRSIRPTDDSVDLKLRADVEIRAEGMLLRISDYEIPVAYRSRSGLADVSVPITNEPKLEFTGQGTITSWIAEIADSALNLETHGQVIFKAVAEGLDGSGSKAVVQYRDAPSNGVVSGSVDLLLVDNALVRMGFRIVGRSLTPDDAVVQEAMALAGRLIRDAEQDYADVRDALAFLDG